MFCKFCGEQISDESKFCCHCGKRLIDDNVCEVVNKPSVRNKVFAFVGFGLGITGFVFGLIPLLGLYAGFFSIPGIVFSSIGVNSTKASYAKKGKIFSILGLVLGIVISVLTIVLIALLN